MASRNVGYIAGAILVALAFSPKLTATLLIIPAPVMGAYLLVVMGTYVVEGIRTVGQDGLDYKKALIVGLAFSVGVAMENSDIISTLPGVTWLQFLDNGLTAGTVAAVLMTWFVELTSARSRRMEAPLDDTALSEIDEFLLNIAGRSGWDDYATHRLRAVGEETLLSLMHQENGADSQKERRLTVVARPEGGAVELEFFAKLKGENLQDQLAYLDEEEPHEGDASFRLLRHYAESVRHQKYNGVDVVKVRVSEGYSNRVRLG